MQDWYSRGRPLIDKYVQPFYLKMMRYNATTNGERLAPEIAPIAAAASADDLLALLGAFWRERVMGAWLSVASTDRRVHAAVIRALTNSQGSLDSPPLAVAAILAIGPGALDALQAYHDADVANNWGAADTARAAVQHLRLSADVRSSLPVPEERTREAFDRLMHVGNLIRGGSAGRVD
jgi:hypothetical protein